MPSKGDYDPHLHFEDKNVFIHCMPSKATMSSSTFQRRQCLQSLHAFKGDNVLIYISKTTMSSVIVCLQRRQYPHLHFEDDNVFSHCMPSKGDNVFIFILKMTMYSPQKFQYPFPLCFVGLDVLCSYALKKRRVKMKMKMN